MGIKFDATPGTIRFTEYGCPYIPCDDNNKQEETIMEEKKIIPGMKTCDVCGRDFPLVVERRYVVKSDSTPILFSSERLYDAIDCPHCGCQNVLHERKRTVPCETDKEDK